MNFSEALDEYQRGVDLWLEAAKKEVAAVAKLQKAVGAGNIRDLEKVRNGARIAADVTAERAMACGPLTFEVAQHLRDGYLDELKEAAESAGVKLFERDGVIFCYPSLVRLEPDLLAVRIDKKLDFNIRAETLTAVLKKSQATDPKAKPERFIETLLEAYQFLRAKKGQEGYIDISLFEIYGLLTLLPGSANEYTLLDFTRDLYFLDISGITESKAGWRHSWASATVGREKSVKQLPFVTRDGQERLYAAVRFSPPSA